MANASVRVPCVEPSRVLAWMRPEFAINPSSWPADWASRWRHMVVVHGYAPRQV
ncbi:putative protein without homology [Propionibacterium freudenreichii subsp. shermanii]|nr:putative protein without homology [Propionibacterium freudenreichii subsp. shermanii]